MEMFLTQLLEDTFEVKCSNKDFMDEFFISIFDSPEEELGVCEETFHNETNANWSTSNFQSVCKFSVSVQALKLEILIKVFILPVEV